MVDAGTHISKYIFPPPVAIRYFTAVHFVFRHRAMLIRSFVPISIAVRQKKERRRAFACNVLCGLAPCRQPFGFDSGGARPPMPHRQCAVLARLSRLWWGVIRQTRCRGPWPYGPSCPWGRPYSGPSLPPREARPQCRGDGRPPSAHTDPG